MLKITNKSKLGLKPLASILTLLVSFVFLKKVSSNDNQEIKISFEKGNKINYTEIKGFKVVYDLHINENSELFIPDFQTGIIFRFSRNLESLPKLDGYQTKTGKKKFENIHAVYSVTNRLYVVEMKLNRVLEIINGSIVNSFGSDKLVSPVNIEQLPDKFLYISNWKGNAIDKYDLYGRYISSLDITSNIASWSPHIKKNYGLLAPHSIKQNSSTKQYFIADQYNKRVVKIDENQKIKILNWSFAEKNTVWEPVVASNKNTNSIFQEPTYVELMDNILLVTDTTSNRVLMFNSSTGHLIGCIGEITNLLSAYNGGANIKFSVSHIPFNLNNPYGIRFDKNNSRLYVADRKNGRVVIFKSKDLLEHLNHKKQ